MPPRVDRERNRCSGEASGRIFVRNRIGDVLACEMQESPTKHPATSRGRGKAVKVYSAKGRRRHRTKVKPRRGVAEGKTPDPLELGRVVGRLTRGAGDSEEAVRAGARHGYA